MLRSLTLLLLFQLTGEVLTRFFALPVPGPVVGMLLLFVALILRGGVGGELRTAAQNILAHLSLLFVPAGVGVMLHFHRLEGELLPIAAALVASTLLAVAATALTLARLGRRRGPEARP